MFITDQILLSLDPLRTASDREVERVPISLASPLMVAIVGMLEHERVDRTVCGER